MSSKLLRPAKESGKCSVSAVRGGSAVSRRRGPTQRYRHPVMFTHAAVRRSVASAIRETPGQAPGPPVSVSRAQLSSYCVWRTNTRVGAAGGSVKRRVMVYQQWPGAEAIRPPCRQVPAVSNGALSPTITLRGAGRGAQKRSWFCSY